ncbi:MAG TPA: hypothetical protein VN133_05480 [Humibacter sp.]|nr:hypothetical protein [Humibacter sp.]
MDPRQQPPFPLQRAPRARGLRLTVWVLAIALFLALMTLAGSILINRYLSANLSNAYKNPLHVVESQLQLDDIGHVTVTSEFDNTGFTPLGVGGWTMQANITLTGTGIENRLTARLEALGYRPKGNEWVLGNCAVYVTPTDGKADLVLVVDAH